MIDYTRMKRVYPQQKAALTRAVKKGPDAVIATCRTTIAEWDAIGAWPDDWSRWQRALDDVLPWNAPRDLRELGGVR